MACFDNLALETLLNSKPADTDLLKNTRVLGIRLQTKPKIAKPL